MEFLKTLFGIKASAADVEIQGPDLPTRPECMVYSENKPEKFEACMKIRNGL